MLSTGYQANERMFSINYSDEILSRRSNELEAVTHSLARFTKEENIPAGKVVKAHPRRNLIDTTSRNENEDGETRDNRHHDDLKACQAAVLEHSTRQTANGKMSVTFVSKSNIPNVTVAVMGRLLDRDKIYDCHRETSRQRHSIWATTFNRKPGKLMVPAQSRPRCRRSQSRSRENIGTTIGLLGDELALET